MNGPLVIARAVHFAATLLLTGGLAFRCFVAEPVFLHAGVHAKAGSALEIWLRPRLAWIIWAALAAALVSGAAWLVLLAGEIGGVPAAQALAEGLPWTVLTQTTFGDAWTLRGLSATFSAIETGSSPTLKAATARTLSRIPCWVMQSSTISASRRASESSRAFCLIGRTRAP